MTNTPTVDQPPEKVARNPMQINAPWRNGLVHIHGILPGGKEKGRARNFRSTGQGKAARDMDRTDARPE